MFAVADDSIERVARLPGEASKPLGRPPRCAVVAAVVLIAPHEMERAQPQIGIVQAFGEYERFRKRGFHFVNDAR